MFRSNKKQWRRNHPQQFSVKYKAIAREMEQNSRQLYIMSALVLIILTSMGLLIAALVVSETSNQTSTRHHVMHVVTPDFNPVDDIEQ